MKLIWTILIALCLVVPASAQFTTPDDLKQEIHQAIQKQVEKQVKETPVIPTGGVGVPAIIAPPAVIDVGTYAGQAVAWVVAVFGSAIAAFLIRLIYKAAQLVGIKLTQQQLERLDDFIVHGLHAGADMAQKKLAADPNLRISVKDESLAGMVNYVKDHGPATLKALGVNLTDPSVEEALRARAEKLIQDPSVPTPTVLDASHAGAA